MKKLTFLTLTAFLLFGAANYAEAQNPLRAGNFSGSVGSVKVDSIRWLASGAIPGAKGLIVDTLAGSTLNDTTIAYDIAGTEAVSVMIITQSKNDDSDFTVEAQVGPTDHPTGMWKSLRATWSVDNTAGAQVGGTADTGRDTVLWAIKTPSDLPDSSTAVEITLHGMLPPRSDLAHAASNRWLRFWVDPDGAAATDSTFFTGIITRVYPR